MKKRLLCLVLSLLMFLSVFPVVQASSPAEEQIIYLDDGRYIVVTIDVSVSRSIYSKTGQTKYESFSSDGILEWKIVLNATYIYTGTSATCTQSTISVTVYADNWYEVSKTAGKSGASATGSVTMGRKVLGVTVAKETYDLSLTCSPTGTLS